MKKIFLGCFLLITLLLCKVVQADNKVVLNIALIHTFSKADPMCYDPYGKNLFNGVEMAWEDFQKNNPGLQFDLKFNKYDLADKKKNAIEMVDAAVRDNAIAAIGCVCSDLAILGGQRAQQLAIPIITPSASDDRIADIGEYVFMASFRNSYQGEVLSNFAYKELNKRNTLIVKSVDCPYCISLADAYKRTFTHNGGNVVAEIDILTSDYDFSKVVATAKKYKYDSVLLPNYAKQVAGIIAEMLSVGIQTTFLGGDAWVWTEKTFDVIGDKPFIGYSVTTWVPEYPTKQSKEFVKRYKDKYDDKIGDTAPHSYDAATLLFDAIKNSPIHDRVHVKDALHRLKTLNGITGRLVFNGNNYPRRPILVMATSNHKQQILKIIDPK